LVGLRFGIMAFAGAMRTWSVSVACRFTEKICCDSPYALDLASPSNSAGATLLPSLMDCGRFEIEQSLQELPVMLHQLVMRSGAT